MPINLAPLRLDADFGGTATPTRSLMLKFARRVAAAIGVQAVLIVIGTASFLSRMLWKPLAFLTVACFVVAVAFLTQSDYRNAISAAFFCIFCLGAMAGIKALGACTVHSRESRKSALKS